MIALLSQIIEVVLGDRASDTAMHALSCRLIVTAEHKKGGREWCPPAAPHLNFKQAWLVIMYDYRSVSKQYLLIRRSPGRSLIL